MVSGMSTPTKEVALGERIKALRHKQGLRQTDLADRAGLSWRHLLRIEKGEGGVTKAVTLARIAGVLGITVTELTGDEEDDEEADLPLSPHEFEMLGDLLGRLSRHKARA